MGWTLGLPWPVAQQIVQTIIIVALIVGIMAFMSHRGLQAGAMNPPTSWNQPPPAEPRTEEMHEEQIVSDLLGRQMKELRRRTDHLHEHPKDAEDIMLQLKRMLPAEGWLTERLATLREKMHHIEHGDVDRIKEIQSILAHSPAEQKAEVAKQLTMHHKQLAVDTRLERLDEAVAETERRIVELTRQAQDYLAAHDYRKLHDVLQSAQKIQKHNSRLFKLIEGTEKQLATLALRIAKEQRGVSGP
jgi:hypothetical protein